MGVKPFASIPADMDAIEIKGIVAHGGVEPVIEDEEQGIVTAIVSVTGIQDHVKDVILPGAYTKTLGLRKPKGIRDHDWKNFVSKPLEVKELFPGDAELPKEFADGTPWPIGAGALRVKAQYNMNTTRGREAFEDAKFMGPDQEWSIGYRVPQGGATKDDKGVRQIKELDLFEYSMVLWGANSQARTLAVKDLLNGGINADGEQEDEGTKSDSPLDLMLKGIEDAFKAGAMSNDAFRDLYRKALDIESTDGGEWAADGHASSSTTIRKPVKKTELTNKDTEKIILDAELAVADREALLVAVKAMEDAQDAEGRDVAEVGIGNVLIGIVNADESKQADISNLASDLMMDFESKGWIVVEGKDDDAPEDDEDDQATGTNVTKTDDTVKVEVKEFDVSEFADLLV